MAWFRSRLRREDGFTLVELMSSMAVLLVGVLGVIGTMDRTRDAVGVSEARETAVHRAERELERIRALPYTQLGLSSMPADSPNAADPAFDMVGTSYQWDRSNSSRVSDVVTGGTITPRTTWNDGRLSGTLQVFVTRYDDPVVTGTWEARRVIVAATIDGNLAPTRPAVLSTVIHDPTVTP